MTGQIMSNRIELDVIQGYDLAEAYELYKVSLFNFVRQTFGWREQYQHARFYSSYPPETLFWVTDKHRHRIGLVCFHDAGESLHLGLLLLYESYQGIGFGSLIMEKLEALAADSGKPVSLSTFKDNHRAVTFYQRRGYLIENRDEYFYEMSKSVSRI